MPGLADKFYKGSQHPRFNFNIDDTANALMASKIKTVSMPTQTDDVVPYMHTYYPNAQEGAQKSFDNTMKENGLAATQNNYITKELTPEQMNRLVQAESGDEGYTSLNRGSGAYGKYQIIPSTAAYYSKKLGFTGNEWKLPENQDKMMAAITADNIAGLQRNNLPTDLFHVYGAHQQGVRGFNDIMNNKLTPQLEDKLRDNLPDKFQNLEGNLLRNTWVNYWKNKMEDM